MSRDIDASGDASRLLLAVIWSSHVLESHAAKETRGGHIRGWTDGCSSLDVHVWTSIVTVDLLVPSGWRRSGACSDRQARALATPTQTRCPAPLESGRQYNVVAAATHVLQPLSRHRSAEERPDLPGAISLPAPSLMSWPRCHNAWSRTCACRYIASYPLRQSLKATCAGTADTSHSDHPSRDAVDPPLGSWAAGTTHQTILDYRETCSAHGFSNFDCAQSCGTIATSRVVK